jgi:predicted kinase
MRKLILIRGPSGSGKSTIASHLGGKPKENWFETDMYLYNDAGQYEWTPQRLESAIENMRQRTFESLRDGKELVICSSVTTKLRFVRPLEALAAKFGYEVQIIRSPRPWDLDVLFQRNKHNVPRGILQKHIENYQDHPNEVEWTDMSIFR